MKPPPIFGGYYLRNSFIMSLPPVERAMPSRVAIFSCLLLLSVVPDGLAEEEITGLFRGAGTYSCSQFTTQYNNDPKLVEGVYFTWAQGFMSGLNMEMAFNSANSVRGYRDLNGSIDAQHVRIRIYCGAHPLASFYQAVLDVFESLPVRPMKE